MSGRREGEEEGEIEERRKSWRNKRVGENRNQRTSNIDVVMME